MTDTCSFDVWGIPAPKGSMTRMPNGAMMPAGTTASRKRMVQWRQAIRDEARTNMDGRPPFLGPIRLTVEFRLPVPASMRKTEHGWLCHTKRPDVDKLFRMLADALTNIVWYDDSQVCFSAINKVYAWDGMPGASVDVVVVSDQSAKYFAELSNRLRNAITD